MRIIKKLITFGKPHGLSKLVKVILSPKRFSRFSLVSRSSEYSLAVSNFPLSSLQPCLAAYSPEWLYLFQASNLLLIILFASCSACLHAPQASTTLPLSVSHNGSSQPSMIKAILSGPW